jgi:hypothetical protein
MSEVARSSSLSGSLVTWVVIAGAIVFGFSLVALLELRAVFPGYSANGWAVIPLAIVLAALLGLTATRLTLGIGRTTQWWRRTTPRSAPGWRRKPVWARQDVRGNDPLRGPSVRPACRERYDFMNVSHGFLT